MSSQRDVFIDNLFNLAMNDKNIVLLSVDMGAPALDKWRENLPNQFFSMGISEQNALNVAAGLSRGGKKVFIYFMAVWIHRCFEQIRYSSAIAKNPITILGNGVALGYAPAGPAHEPNEDVAVMKSLLGINIWSPWNTEKIGEIVNTCLSNSELNYVRLERSSKYHNLDSKKIKKEYSSLDFEIYSKRGTVDKEIFIFSYSYMVNKCFEVIENYNGEKNIKFIVLNKIIPISTKLLDVLKKSEKNNVVIIEEQTKLGSLSESLATFFLLNEYEINLKLFNLDDKYIFDNGDRDLLLELNGLNMENFTKTLNDF